MGAGIRDSGFEIRKSVRRRADQGVLRRIRRGGMVGLPEQYRHQFGSVRSVMIRDFAEDRVERAGLDWRVIRNRDRVRRGKLACEANVGTGLARHLIVETCQCLDQLPGIDIARQLHAASTSSRTKCKRITLGPVSSSKWQRTASRTFARKLSRVSASVKMAWPSARAVYPPSATSSTWKTISFMRASRISAGPSYCKHTKVGIGSRSATSIFQSPTPILVPGGSC